MPLLEEARARFVRLCNGHGIDRGRTITIAPLTPDQAIGKKADDAFVIKKGRERVVEAVFGEARGQAFTDQPRTWSGTLHDLLALNLRATRDRAAFVAGMNAVLRSLGAASCTVHCRDDEPARCGAEMACLFLQRYGRVRVGMIGLQPAILAALAGQLAPENVRVLDLNADNIGSTKNAVPVWDGATDLPRLVDWCDVGLATGSSIVNGTIDDIARRFERAGKPVALFGNTISGAAALLGLDRICPFAR